MPHGSSPMITTGDSLQNCNESPVLAEIGHSVQFYEDASYISQSVAWLSHRSLEQQRGVIIIATTAVLNAVEDYLAAQLSHYSKIKQQGQIKYLDAHILLNQLMVNGAPQADKFKESVGALVDSMQKTFGKVWIYGEMVNLLWQKGDIASAIQLENLWTELGQVLPFSLLCGYQIDNFKSDIDGELFRSICCKHHYVLPAESFLALVEQDAKHRSVAILQQKAEALANEIATHNEVKKELAELLEEKENQIHAISHELKTPLTAIILQAQVLLRVVSKKNAEDYTRDMYKIMEEIKDNTKRLNQLIHNLMNINRKL